MNEVIISKVQVKKENVLITLLPSGRSRYKELISGPGDVPSIFYSAQIRSILGQPQKMEED